MNFVLILFLTVSLIFRNIRADNSDIAQTLLSFANILEEADLSKVRKDDIIEKKHFIFYSKKYLHETNSHRKFFNSNENRSYNNAGTVPSVRTKNGILIGETNKESHAFYSVPYAKPPIGSRRFLPPEPVDDYSELNVSIPDYRSCWQPLGCEPDCDPIEGNLTEDCLLLTINVPKHVNLSNPEIPPNNRLPVLLWIHGGFYLFGSGTSYKADSRELSENENVIVVRISYRLGALGFISFQDGNRFIEGNQGQMDQQLAMKWIQENIEKFGGDPSKVTIFGQSAGAQSVMFHLLSSVSEPLFSRAILQSNPAIFSYQTPQEFNNTTTQLLLEVLQCDEGPSCLRTISPKKLVEARGRLLIKSLGNGDLFGAIEPFRPVIDGKEYIAQPITLFKYGRWNSNKELIVGTTQDEMAYIQAIFEYLNIPLRRQLFESLNNAILGEDNGKIMIDFYGDSDTEDLSENFSNEVTDFFFVCPSRAIARFMSHAQKHVYYYNLAYTVSDETCLATGNFIQVCGHAYHSSEPILIFKSDHAYGFNFSIEDETISDMLSSYWKNFADTGNPNKIDFSDYTFWPIYSNDTDNPWKNIVFVYPQSEVAFNYKSEICDLWDATNLYFKNETLPIDISTSTTANEAASTTTTNIETTFGNEERTGTGGAICNHCSHLFVSMIIFGWFSRLFSSSI